MDEFEYNSRLLEVEPRYYCHLCTLLQIVILGFELHFNCSVVHLFPQMLVF